jgi:hypothetical protein
MSKTHTFLVSDESVNSYGFSIITDGINTAQFEKNPIMLYMHERPHIIGKWENLRKENGQLFADAVFDIEDPIAKEIAGKVERGFLKSASIGITVLSKKDSVINTCNLVEISIVDIGSNGNALRLYTDTGETMQLKLNEFSSVGSITSILGLSKDKTTTEIIAQVKSLVQLKDEYKSKLDKIEQEQEQEAIFFVDKAIELKKIPSNFRDMHLKAFKDDFNKARLELSNLFPFKTISLVSMLNEANEKKKIDPTDKTKWTLNDYRKFAPKELEENPQLFQELLKAKNN